MVFRFKSFFVLAFIGAIILACPLLAESIVFRPSSLVEVEIHGDSYGLIPLNRDYDDSYRIVARRGERYRVVVKNHSGRRLAMVISIDGLNIISGKTSYHRPDESMYLLEPGQTGSFTGWRTDYNNVQRFYFSDAEDSYASRTGQTGQLGWIKVAVFQERQPIIVRPQKYYEDSERSMAESPQAGTGYGEREYSPVQTASFNPESLPVQMLRIKYDFDSRLYYPDQPQFTQPPRDY
ncbi:MAG: hypothetical protein AB1403_04800 [Candidatus Riflebacteria bacterium]